MNYSPVSAWMLDYFYKFATGTFKSEMNSEQVSGVFNDLMTSPVEMIIWPAIIVVFGFFVCSRGLQKGIEKVSKVMMVALLALIIILAINSMMLSNAEEGLSFYLVPDFGKVKNVGLGKVITSAMSQAFFTLGLGIASMEIFGSYMNKDRTLYGEAVQIWGTLFFLFMTFASFSTVIAVFENLVAFLTDTFGMSRTKASIINGIIMFFACLPCIFGFNIWSDFNILGKGVLDLEDFVVSNLLLPIGAMVYLLFCTTKFGWGFDNYFEECNTGKGLKLSRVLKPYLKYALPVLIVIVFVQGFIG